MLSQASRTLARVLSVRVGRHSTRDKGTEGTLVPGIKRAEVPISNRKYRDLKAPEVYGLPRNTSCLVMFFFDQTGLPVPPDIVTCTYWPTKNKRPRPNVQTSCKPPASLANLYDINHVPYVDGIMV